MYAALLANQISVNIFICFFLFAVEMAVLVRDGDKTKIRIMPAKEVEAIISEFEKSEAAASSSKEASQK